MTSGPVGLAADVSVDRLRAVVETLADNKFEGRRVGTAGGRGARDWLAGRLGDLGAAVSVDEFAVTGVRELTRTPELEWADGARIHRLIHRRDFAEHLVSADLPVRRTAGVAMAGARDVRGRWVVAPSVIPDVMAGAAGVLVPRGADEAGWMPKMIAGPPVLPLPVLAVRADIHEAIGRASAVSASVPLRTVEVTGHNIHGEFRPSSVDNPRVLLTAHYDGVGDDPEQRLPAAADNASGVAVVLEAARALASSLPERVGLQVALLDGEEAGAQGSAWHAPRVQPGTHVINIDGVGALAGPAAVEAGGPAHDLLAALDEAGRQTHVVLKAGGMPSDNRRYAAAGLASVGIGMGIPGYQTPAETPDRVEPAALMAATRLVIATVHLLVQS